MKTPRVSFPFCAAAFSFSLYFLLPYSSLFEPWLTRGEATAILAALAAIWLACVGGYVFSMEDRAPWVRLSSRDWFVLAVFFCVFAALQVRYLILPIAYMGDEEGHLSRALWVEAGLAESISNGGSRLMIAGLVVLAVAVASAVPRWRGRYLVPVAIVAGALFLGSPWIAEAPNLHLQRYPPMMPIIETALANRFFSTKEYELMHRLAALIPMAGFAVGPFLVLRSRAVGWIEATAALALPALLPTIFYYSGMLYIEPIELLLQGVIFARLLAEDSLDVRSWFEIALLASCIGLVKETAPPFLAALAGCFAWRVFTGAYGRWQRQVLTFLRLMGVLFLPAVPYFAARLLVGIQPGLRAWIPYPQNYFHMEFYRNNWGMIFNQFTLPFTLVAMAGFLLMARSRRHLDALVVSLLSLLFYGLYYSLDQLAWVGHSRYALRYVPTLVAGFTGFLLTQRELGGERLVGPRARHLMVLAFLILFCLGLIPWRLADREGWGCPGTGKTQECHLPYDKALETIARDHSRLKFIIFNSGGEYPYYPVEFYLRKYGLSKEFLGVVYSRAMPPGRAAATARARGADLLVFANHYEAHAPRSLPGLPHLQRFVLGPRTIDLYKVGSAAAGER